MFDLSSDLSCEDVKLFWYYLAALSADGITLDFEMFYSLSIALFSKLRWTRYWFTTVSYVCTRFFCLSLESSNQVQIDVLYHFLSLLFFRYKINVFKSNQIKYSRDIITV